MLRPGLSIGILSAQAHSPGRGSTQSSLKQKGQSMTLTRMLVHVAMMFGTACAALSQWPGLARTPELMTSCEGALSDAERILTAPRAHDNAPPDEQDQVADLDRLRKGLGDCLVLIKVMTKVRDTPGQSGSSAHPTVLEADPIVTPAAPTTAPTEPMPTDEPPPTSQRASSTVADPA